MKTLLCGWLLAVAALLPVARGETSAAAALENVPSLGREVWIAPDRKHGTGAGTAEDPFDGSSADKLDALFNHLPPRIQIHLLAGTFHTAGSHAWTWKDGWILRGAGIDLTTLQLVPGPPNPTVPQYGFATPVTGLSRVEVHDMTWDGNISQQPDGYAVVADVIAAQGGFWNVRLRAWGGTPATLHLEQFGLIFVADEDGSHASNFTISGCVVEPAVAAAGRGGASMLGCNVQGTGPYTGLRAAGVIENNVVTGSFQADCGIALAGAFANVRVANNRVRRVVRGFHQDTVGDQEGGKVGSFNVDVNHNFFESVQCAFAIGGDIAMTGYRFTDNVVTLIGTASPANGTTPPAGTYFQGNVRRALVARNYFSKSREVIPGQNFFNLSAFAQQNPGGPNTNNTYLDNLIDPAIQINYPLSRLDSTVRRGNRFTNGQTVPVFTDTPQDLPDGTTFNGLPIQTATGDGSSLTNLKVAGLWDEAEAAPSLTTEGREINLQPGYRLSNDAHSAGLDQHGFFGDGSRLTGTLRLVPKPPAADSPGTAGDVYLDGENHRAVFYAPDGSGTNWFQVPLKPYTP